MTKVIVVPGIGATWNVEAFITCEVSPYSKKWGLAPYAKNIYDPLLSALPLKGWTVIPFYYDWRQDVKDSALLLNLFLQYYAPGDEKVDLVGHSMGGLIGRNYLETQQGGNAAKFLAVGAPNQGSALAYPAVAHTEIWFNDLTQKIGATLFLNHCGVPPSMQNLLPTYSYLRDNKTQQLKDVSAAVTKNTYLPTDFSSPFWGVKVGTLIGSGFPTLNIIDVTKNAHWPDGKPVGKETVNEGDGVVLAASAQIPGSFSTDIINQSHAGIIASTEGINHILNFLGSPGIDDPAFIEETSALILVGYPGNFSITDRNGQTTHSEDGMIAVMHPKTNDYQLQLAPTSSTLTFVVAQFFANGQTEYKEYTFKGTPQEPKIIEFDAKHPKADILRSAKDYQKPPFPTFWLEFWKFWNKLRK